MEAKIDEKITTVTKFMVKSVKTGSTETVDFGTRVNNAAVAVQGFHVSYGNNDHHVKTIDVRAAIGNISGSTVSVSSTCIMEDKSNNKANGTVEILVIADCYL